MSARKDCSRQSKPVARQWILAPAEIRVNIIRISHKSGHGHIPTSFSIIECLCAVYNQMRRDPLRPDDPERDIFILSKWARITRLVFHYCFVRLFPDRKGLRIRCL